MFEYFPGQDSANLGAINSHSISPDDALIPTLPKNCFRKTKQSILRYTVQLLIVKRSPWLMSQIPAALWWSTLIVVTGFGLVVTAA